jgi:WD40 repeat protein
VLYAATDFGRTVAMRLADRSILWERPAVKTVMEWSGQALALDPTGNWLAVAGSSQTGFDHLVLEARTGRVEAQVRLCAMVNDGRVATTKTVRVQALAFHPTGWLAAATNAGVIVELRSSGDVSAFRGATHGIEALAFCDEGRTLLVGGAEPNLRLWPVDLEDEARLRMVIIDDPKAKRRTRLITRA